MALTLRAHCTTPAGGLACILHARANESLSSKLVADMDEWKARLILGRSGQPKKIKVTLNQIRDVMGTVRVGIGRKIRIYRLI